MLDHCCVIYMSNMFSGSKHDNKKVPLITAAGDSNRKLCSLYLGIMDRMDVKLDQFGDTDSGLVGL